MTRDAYLTAIDGLDGKRVMVRQTIPGSDRSNVIHGRFRYDPRMPYIAQVFRGKRDFNRIPYAQIIEIKEAA